ncbi:periplasmic chaperone for outer membrane proteins Skp [Propionispira arboris]|uniref:Periplasmic chaperone for outer membrane proteins Skp n=2 Tax=Propionispira arboris TaxID=84035 RepID=A0A1H7A1A2_9FIRM|nr:periplasmic chaperone for outer membrane proteins Skp [Propionispira arboris]
MQKRFFMMMHLLRRYGIYVDFIYLMNQHPDTVQANNVLKTEQEAAKQEFETKSVGMNDQDKQKLDQKLAQRIEQKRLELIKPISEKVVAATNAVAGEKGLSIVIGKNEVVCGGTDITADVLKKITGK